jgi:hypothetical protein
MGNSHHTNFFYSLDGITGQNICFKSYSSDLYHFMNQVFKRSPFDQLVEALEDPEKDWQSFFQENDIEFPEDVIDSEAWTEDDLTEH